MEIGMKERKGEIKGGKCRKEGEVKQEWEGGKGREREDR